MAVIPTNNYVDHYDSELSHHRAWLQAVLDRLQELDPKTLQPGGELRSIWVAAVQTKASPANPYWVVDPLLALIRKYESKALGEYDAANRRRSGDMPGGMPGLSTLSIREVMTMQARGQIHAAGAYQIIGKTLGEAVERAGVPRTERFSRKVQDWFGVVLVLGGWKRPKLTAYLLGQSKDLDAAQTDLAHEWASLPLPNGRGAYDGDSAGNRSHASVTEVRDVLIECRKRIGGRPLQALGLVPPVPPMPPKQSPAPAPVPPAAAKPPAKKVLNVRQYYSQRDSATGHSDRMCFSSTCAMLVKFLRPDALKGVNADDRYLEKVFRYGDTTVGSAQVKALADYGIKATFTTTAQVAAIEAAINKGYPVPVGYLHRGHVSAPSGGGHWALIYGYDETHFYVMDPWGEPDLITGATLNSNGKALKFGRKNFIRRWSPEGPGHGYAILVNEVALS